ncbi:MAG: hypothetical protein J2P15_17275 [Micromonosporaceae bacterium]|nr:hypothetical protein [Micromonosporaceae bacterium]
MIAELATVLAVFAGGCALLRALGLSGWALPPLGFLAGACLLLDVGFLQLVTGAPTTPVLTLAAIVVLPLAWCVLRWRRGHDLRIPVPATITTVVLLAVAVPVLRAANLVKWNMDSLDYLKAGRLLAEGGYRSTASTDLVVERVLGVPLLHAAANLSGDFYLRSITPLLFIALLAAMVWLLRAGIRAAGGRTPAARWSNALIALAMLLLLTNDRVVYNAFYLNAHLLVAALFVLIGAGGWLLAVWEEAPRPALMALQLIAVPALVISRPEGALLAVLLALPTVLSRRIDRRHRMVLLATLGGSVALFAGFQAWLFHDRGTAIPVSVAGPALLGVLALAAVPLLRLGFVHRHADHLLWAAEALLWLVLLAYTVRGPGVLYRSARATYINQIRGTGAWGLFVVLLCVLLLVAMLLLRIPYQAHLRFPLTTFVPLVLVLAYVREGAYRVGDADSLNRMIMHVVPLAVVYLLLLLTTGRLPARGEAADPPAGSDAAEDTSVLSGPTVRTAQK